MEWNFRYMTTEKGERLMVYSSRVPYAEVPAVVKELDALKEKGWQPAFDGITVYKYSGEAGDTYQVKSRFMVKNEEAGLRLEANSPALVSLEDAVNAVAINRGSLIYFGDPVEGGKGQLKRCREIAKRIVERCGTEAGTSRIYDGQYVLVDYETRGGRGGRTAKIATRRFTFEELGAGNG